MYFRYLVPYNGESKVKFETPAISLLVNGGFRALSTTPEEGEVTDVKQGQG